MIEAKLEEMHTELRQLRGEVKGLRELLQAAGLGAAQPQERFDQMVGAEYVARLFDCSVLSVRRGYAGTHHVRWTARRPLHCTRAEAHNALRRYVESRARRRR